MNTHSSTHSLAQQNYSYKGSMMRLKENSKRESILVLRQLYFLCRLTVVTSIGFLIFLFGFSFTKSFFKVVSRPFFVYVTVTYLTLLPGYLFFVFLFLPIRLVGGILGITVLYSFFKVFLV